MLTNLPTQITLINGRKELVTRNEDLVDIAEECVCYEYSKLIEDVINTSDAESQYAEKKFNSDMRAYENQLDDYNNCLYELNNIVSDMQDYLDESKRITRNNIEEYVIKLNNIIKQHY